MKPILPPFPYFGGKSKVSEEVWRRFGDVPLYIEPFFGSGAVLFGRPGTPRHEVANDKNSYLANFWRAIKQDPDGVAKYADWPVNETDLHARHTWLRNQKNFRDKMLSNPEFYDSKIAGWWVWGACQWIGGGWCGVSSKPRPRIESQYGIRSVVEGRRNLRSYFNRIQERLRYVDVCCGDWMRVLSPHTFEKPTAVFLDPPYSLEANRAKSIYTIESGTVAHNVRDWAIKNGERPSLRIALCGYEGEHQMPKNWTTFWWKAAGFTAFGHNQQGKANQKRERIWFSPYCLHRGLF